MIVRGPRSELDTFDTLPDKVFRKQTSEEFRKMEQSKLGRYYFKEKLFSSSIRFHARANLWLEVWEFCLPKKSAYMLSRTMFISKNMNHLKSQILTLTNIRHFCNILHSDVSDAEKPLMSDLNASLFLSVTYLLCYYEERQMWLSGSPSLNHSWLTNM